VQHSSCWANHFRQSWRKMMWLLGTHTNKLCNQQCNTIFRTSILKPTMQIFIIIFLYKFIILDSKYFPLSKKLSLCGLPTFLLTSLNSPLLNQLLVRYRSWSKFNYNVMPQTIWAMTESRYRDSTTEFNLHISYLALAACMVACLAAALLWCSQGVILLVSIHQ
jgi:hypothetical protein